MDNSITYPTHRHTDLNTQTSKDTMPKTIMKVAAKRSTLDVFLEKTTTSIQFLTALTTMTSSQVSLTSQQTRENITTKTTPTLMETVLIATAAMTILMKTHTPMELMSALSMTLSLETLDTSTLTDSATIAPLTFADQEDATPQPTTASLTSIPSLTLSTQHTSSPDTCQAVSPPLTVLTLTSLTLAPTLTITHHPSEVAVFSTSTHSLLPSTTPIWTLMVTWPPIALTTLTLATDSLLVEYQAAVPVTSLTTLRDLISIDMNMKVSVATTTVWAHTWTTMAATSLISSHRDLTTHLTTTQATVVTESTLPLASAQPLEVNTVILEPTSRLAQFLLLFFDRKEK